MYAKVMALLAVLQLDNHEGEIYISMAKSKASVTIIPTLPLEKIALIPNEMRETTTLITDDDQSIFTIQG